MQLVSTNRKRFAKRTPFAAGLPRVTSDSLATSVLLLLYQPIFNA